MSMVTLGTLNSRSVCVLAGGGVEGEGEGDEGGPSRGCVKPMKTGGMRWTIMATLGTQNSRWGRGGRAIKGEASKGEASAV